MTCQSLISDLSDVESPSVATARMHLLRRFSRYGPEKLAPHAGGPCVCGERLKNGCSTSLFWSRSCRAGCDSDFGRVFGGFCTTDFLQLGSLRAGWGNGHQFRTTWLVAAPSHDLSVVLRSGRGVGGAGTPRLPFSLGRAPPPAILLGRRRALSRHLREQFGPQCQLARRQRLARRPVDAVALIQCTAREQRLLQLGKSGHRVHEPLSAICSGARGAIAAPAAW